MNLSEEINRLRAKLDWVISQDYDQEKVLELSQELDKLIEAYMENKRYS